MTKYPYVTTANSELQSVDCRLPTANCCCFVTSLLSITLLLTALNLSAQNPFIQHYTISNGLPSNHVAQIYQDSKKFIWFACYNGLVRYDGSNFTTYGKKDGLSYFQVFWPREDSFGRIWFRCPTGKWNFFYQNKFYNNVSAQFLDSLDLPVFFQDKDRIIYFYGGGRKIYALDTNNRIKRYEIPSHPVKYDTLVREGMNIKQLTKSLSGEFLIWTPTGVYRTRNLSQKPVLLSSITKDYTGWRLENKTNNLMIRLFNTKTQKYVYVKYADGLPVDSTDLPIKKQSPGTDVLEDATGLLWICTLDQGVFCLKNKQIIFHMDLKEAIFINQDHENNIWIGTRKNGVYKLSPYILFLKHYGTSYFDSEGIEAMDSDFKNGIWCTNGKRIYLLKNNEIYCLDWNLKPCRSFIRVYGLENNCIVINEDYSYFALTGIRVDRSSTKVYFNHKFKLPYVSSSHFAKNKTGREFCGWAQPEKPGGARTVVTFNVGKQFPIINRVVIPGKFYGKFFYDANNNLVINAEKMYILHNHETIPFKQLSRFNGKYILSHQILNNSTELYHTEDDSIYLINNETIFNLTSHFNYPVDQQIYWVKYDEPTLYLSTNRDVYKCDNPLEILKNKPVNLELVDINFNNIHDILVKNDSLYVASDDGLTIIPETMLSKIRTQTPIPYFQSILVNDTSTDISQKEITLTGNNKIKFVFGCINYSANPVIFSYMLEGLDHDWTTGKGTNVVYQNLSKGNYIFKVRARKATAEWSDPIEFTITIKAHFWQHPLFLVFLSLLFTGLIALIIIRRKNIQIKRRELDNQLISLEQKALQSMMNPHFIFNSLGSIQTYLLQNKSGEAGLYLSQFARLIRQNLNAINASCINLEEEIDRLKNYLDLEKLRMEDKFEYRIEVAANLETDELQIPSMIIQPFVENAIWHGIAFLKEKGQIIIRFLKKDDKSLDVIIEDNGIGMKRSETYSANKEKRAHLGMELARKRLEILGRKFSVTTCLKYSELFPGNPNPGTKVELVVPTGL